ncbi:MAG: DUF4388 domain-containing protein [Gemmatimonadetes bacterium]|nr:DUF4388 domain-containing protein [Gemmatimonadota bacterium]
MSEDLKGKLAVFSPISIMQFLNLAESTGRLDFAVPNNRASVFFVQGNVTFAGIANRSLKLGEYLVQTGLVEQSVIDELLQKPNRKKLGVLLVESGILEQDQLRRAVEEQIKQVIYEIVRWTRGTFTFRHGAEPTQQDIFIDIPLDHLVLEGVKRLDEEREKPE